MLTEHILMNEVYLTKKGFNNFSKEQEDLTQERKLAVIQLSRAREMGDLSENGFYKSARSNLSAIDRRLRQLDYILKNSTITKKPQSTTVALGGMVKLATNKKERIFEIVGKYEADPKSGKISNESPVGKSLLGKRKGEKIFVNKITYEILEIT